MDIEDLIDAIKKYHDKIDHVEIAIHDRLKTEPDILTELKNVLGEEKVKKLNELS